MAKLLEIDEPYKTAPLWYVLKHLTSKAETHGDVAILPDDRKVLWCDETKTFYHWATPGKITDPRFSLFRRGVKPGHWDKALGGDILYCLSRKVPHRKVGRQTEIAIFTHEGEEYSCPARYLDADVIVRVRGNRMWVEDKAERKQIGRGVFTVPTYTAVEAEPVPWDGADVQDLPAALNFTTLKVEGKWTVVRDGEDRRLRVETKRLGEWLDSVVRQGKEISVRLENGTYTVV